MDALERFGQFKVRSMQGRYLPPGVLNEFLTSLPAGADLKRLGNSVRGRPIYSVELGHGPMRVMMWSQMHGNESTTTRALADLVQELCRSTGDLLNEMRLLLIPMLNPDGAEDYTRMNANGKDLNRDARALSQPESAVLRRAFLDFGPHFCFNLHDQRTIYSAGHARVPATLSLLAPAADPDCRFPDGRKQAARLAACLAASLDKSIGVGRYDDTYNPDCVGDYFQSRGVPTLLVEAGHFPGDYQRETTRFYAYHALRTALEGLRTGRHLQYSLKQYHGIPENEALFVDILIRNAQFLGPGHPECTHFGIQFEEMLRDGSVKFIPRIAELQEPHDHYGHLEWDASDPLHRQQLEQSPELWDLVRKHFQ